MSTLGVRTRGNIPGTWDRGAASARTRNSALYMCHFPPLLLPISVVTVLATTFFQTALLRSMLRQESGSGIFKWSTTISGSTTLLDLLYSAKSRSMAGESMLLCSPVRLGSYTYSTAKLGACLANRRASGTPIGCARGTFVTDPALSHQASSVCSDRYHRRRPY